MTGVLLLPFHLVMTLSGLIIFFSTFFPGTWKAAYDGEREGLLPGRVRRPTNARRPNRPGTMGSLDAMAAEAARRWGGGRSSTCGSGIPGDAASYVEMRRSYASDLEMNRDQVYFDAATGAVLGRHGSKPVTRVQRVISGIHFVQFENWPLRWLYFLAGLSGCVMIATGFIYWLETRRARHERLGLRGVRVVHALTVGSVTGIVAATLVFFVVNRLLPLGATLGGVSRQHLEMWAFYLAWLLAFVHAGWRPRKAWAEQCLAIAALAIGAVALNWSTTGDHPLRALGRGVPGVAGMDGVLLVAAGLTLAIRRRLVQRAAVVAPDQNPLDQHGRLPVMERTPLLFASALVMYVGFGLLALSQRAHGRSLATTARRRGGWLGSVALALGLIGTLAAEGPSFGALLFTLLLAAAAVAVTFTLTYRPRWLRPLRWALGGEREESRQ